MNNSAQALAAKQALANGFRKKGIAIAVLSGISTDSTLRS